MRTSCQADAALATNTTTFAVLEMREMLAPGGYLDQLKAKGYAVALRVEAAAVPRLLEADLGLAPDWLLFDMPPPADDAATTALENRFDRSRMLYRAASQAGSTTVSYEVKR